MALLDHQINHFQIRPTNWSQMILCHILQYKKSFIY